jgi:hypothetical protein
MARMTDHVQSLPERRMESIHPLEDCGSTQQDLTVKHQVPAAAVRLGETGAQPLGVRKAAARDGAPPLGADRRVTPQCEDVAYPRGAAVAQ